MGRRLTLLLALWLSVFSTVRADAPPQDTYLQIYFTFQEADRLEHGGQYASARAKYQDASDSLDTLKKNHPEWETSMVNFRIKYVQDKLTALADKQDTNAKPSASPSAPAPSSPAPSSLPPPTTMAAPLVSPSDTAATQQRITALETELADTKRKLNDALTQAASLRQRLDAAERALAGVKGSNLEERVASLLDENNSLKSQLNDASQKVKDLQANGADSSVAQLRDQLKTVNQQVQTLEAENQAFRSNTNELKAQLESALAKLDQSDRQSAQLGARADTSGRENEVLRGILTRQLQEQARRDEAKRLATDEISNLHLQTKVLQQQIDVLSSPIVTLSPEERALLHVTAPAPLPAPGTATVIAATTNASANTTSTSTAPAPAKDQASPAAPAQADAAATPPPSASDKPRVPEEVRPLAKLASDYFNTGKYDDAADCYNKIIQKYPDSLYAWSNLGVVRFQQQKYPEAEKALQQAVKLNPNDAFSLSILGVVYYQESRYDDAIDTLTKATALNPEDARTWNYLGISYSQKGWQDAAEKALRKAVDIDPGLGDAQFNLAVIYATQKPPSRELARKHYQAALDQGIPKDPQLEKFFNTPEPVAATPAAASAPVSAPAAAPVPAAATNAPAAAAKP